ncbi:MAG: segregation/condensation protein A [Ignavibacteriaceae bacterium]|nr:segregation/condensation protein A [Ignavibacteriaceae bacterium]
MFKVKLDHFEGPLDLLLFFIKRDELDIYDIPISHITNEYLTYLDFIEMLDLEQAGDFILLAATLMQIKARMLLPVEVDEKGEEIDPRAELVSRLIEYKKYKEMTEEFALLENRMMKINFRSNFSLDEKEKPADLESFLRNVTVYDLARVFKNIMTEMKNEPVHEIKRPPVSLDEQISYVRDKIKQHKRINFRELAKEIDIKLKLIYTFIALLELVKSKYIGIQITENFNDFTLYELETDEL